MKKQKEKEGNDSSDTRDQAYTSSLLQVVALSFFVSCFLFLGTPLSLSTFNVFITDSIFFLRSIYLTLYSDPELILSAITLEKSMTY